MSSDYSDITGFGTLIGVKKGVPKQEDSLIRMSLIFPLEGTFMQYIQSLTLLQQALFIQYKCYVF